MSLLIESIACLDGKFLNLPLHTERMNRSRAEALKISEPVSLASVDIPENAGQGLWKCRVSYDNAIDKVEFTEYTPAKAQTFKLIKAEIAYPYKFADRQQLNELFALRGEADDIIIVKNKLITDSSYGNLIFYDGKNWLTPEQPLLQGTMRASLLASKLISTAVIAVDDLDRYLSFMMINALNPFDDNRALSIENIVN